MMSIPTVGSNQKLVFFKVKEIEPRKFECRLVGFVKDEAALEAIREKVRRILDASSSELTEDNLERKSFICKVPEQTNEAFMKAAMEEGCIFRF